MKTPSMQIDLFQINYDIEPDDKDHSIAIRAARARSEETGPMS